MFSRVRIISPAKPAPSRICQRGRLPPTVRTSIQTSMTAIKPSESASV